LTSKSGTGNRKTPYGFVRVPSLNAFHWKRTNSIFFGRTLSSRFPSVVVSLRWEMRHRDPVAKTNRRVYQVHSSSVTTNTDARDLTIGSAASGETDGPAWPGGSKIRPHAYNLTYTIHSSPITPITPTRMSPPSVRPFHCRGVRTATVTTSNRTRRSVVERTPNKWNRRLLDIVDTPDRVYNTWICPFFFLPSSTPSTHSFWAWVAVVYGDHVRLIVTCSLHKPHTPSTFLDLNTLCTYIYIYIPSANRLYASRGTTINKKTSKADRRRELSRGVTIPPRQCTSACLRANRGPHRPIRSDRVVPPAHRTVPT